MKVWKPCPEPGCPHLVDPATGDCDTHHASTKRRAAQHRTDAARPNARARGYDHLHEQRFRTAVLRRDPTCVTCGAPSRHADHHPLTRRQLVAAGHNPNDPQHGRGLCASCHSRATATHDGGYGNPNAPTTPGGDPPPP